MSQGGQTRATFAACGIVCCDLKKVIIRLRLKINYRLKAILKRCVFSLVLKESKVSKSLIKSGSSFQSLGDEHAKDLSP